MERTQPIPRYPEGVKPDPNTQVVKRYGTHEMGLIWGAERTFEKLLYVQGESALVLSELFPDIVALDHAEEIASKADLKHIKADRIRELEEEKGHDVLAINKSLEEVISKEAASHVNKAKTSADTTEPARALQKRDSLIVVARSIENLRDIIIEKSLEWIDVPHMDTTHLYDALPTVAGRPFAYVAEMLQSGLNLLKFVYDNSLVGKWADATGNHHSATALGIDGMKLQEKFCNKLKIKYMDAPAQIPGLEFEADVIYVITRFGETLNNFANYVAWGRSDDVNIFINGRPQKQEGSAAMPHKNAKNGNPTGEEQTISQANYARGILTTAVSNCAFPYARNLAGSSSGRIILEEGFKFIDHVTRRMADIFYYLKLREDRCKERVDRSYGVVTSQQVMTYLTDHRKVKNPMARSEAHSLCGELATYAWENKIPFVDVVLKDEKISGMLDEKTIRNITDPYKYIGQSKEIIRLVAEKYHHKKTELN
ncbi:MAG: lyase family protein [Nanoarchaeota archaeon]|nr:lyase family protein [Nanoarchaeota archaeon]